MKIGEVAVAAGVTVDTIRFYERRGVLPEPDRRPSGYRDYPAEIVERIRLARSLQGVGLTLDEIVDALAAHDAGGATCDSERWRLDVALERVEQRIADLQAVRRTIRRTKARCESGACSLITVAD
ncbi:MAG: MerR family transcriptional regulator [Ilumatobacter sp.]|nr:MerR family transcriptional regulator [Ilumatobacter sp.]